MMYSKVCPICGEPFETKTKKKIFCTPKCAKRNDYIKYGKAACARFVKNHPERVKEIQEQYNFTHPNRIKLMKKRIRLEAMNYISDELKCSNPNCLVPGGCRDIRALQIDHINGGGNKESREIGKGFRNYQIRYWKYILALPQEEVRKRYQILCALCNTLKMWDNNEFYSKDKKEKLPD